MTLGDRPPVRIDRSEGGSEIRILLVEELYKLYKLVATGVSLTSVSKMPEYARDVREFVQTIISEYTLEGWAIVISIGGVLTLLFQEAVSVGEFEYEFVRSRGLGEGKLGEGPLGGGEYYKVVIL